MRLNIGKYFGVSLFGKFNREGRFGIAPCSAVDVDELSSVLTWDTDREKELLGIPEEGGNEGNSEKMKLFNKRSYPKDKYQ